MIRMAQEHQLTSNLPKSHIFVTLARYTHARKGSPMKPLNACGVLTALLLSSTATSFAAGTGTTAADLLNIGVGARAIGMGEAYVAQADDSSSLYWNPAGLALEEQREAAFAYNQLDQGMSYENGRIGIPLENGGLGASVDYLSYGSIPGYNEQGASIGNQSAYTGVATVGGAWLGNQWSAGANIKGIQEKLADTSANDFAADLGVQAIVPKPVLGGTLRFGAVAQNLGPGMKFISQSDPLPRTFRFGMAAVQMMDRRLNISLDYAKPDFVNGYVAGGAELWVARFLALRAGYTTNHSEGLGVRAGIGIRVKDVSFDYAYAGDGELGMTNRYELSFKFGEPRPILTPEERKILAQAKAAMRQERYEQATLLFDSLIELEPHYKPARRYIKVAMAKLEQQQSEMAARQGTAFEPGAGTARKPTSDSSLDDLEQLLNLGTPKSAQKQNEQPASGEGK